MTRKSQAKHWQAGRQAHEREREKERAYKYLKER